MTIKLGVVMDPIGSINYKKDSTLAMLWEAKARGWPIYYFEAAHLFLQNGEVRGRGHLLDVFHDAQKWYEFGEQITIPLAELDVILMRKDPPFNESYIYTTHLLAHAERHGSLVVNRTQALRDYNEKLFATYFPQCMPPSLVTSSLEKINEFWEEHGDIVCKPLDGMGGDSVYRLQKGDVNARMIFNSLIGDDARYIMLQRYIPAITKGDKRILMINGEPVSYALARIPQGDDWRGNLAAGAKGKAQALSERDQWICAQVGPVLREQGIYFAGLDVIGDYLTEINITSPTCIRELDKAMQVNISAMLMDCVEEKL